MPTLLLKLAGPLQSWGASSRFNQRTTRMEPSKSAVVGMLAAADGRRRSDNIEDLAGLKFGVRSEQEGRIVTDFQTAIDWRNGKVKPLSRRDYLSDACFLVGLEGPREILEALHSTMSQPYFPVYLGRRSCPPVGQIVVGIRDTTLEDTLRCEPWHASLWYRKKHAHQVTLAVSCDAPSATASDEVVNDSPVSFCIKRREYSLRSVVHRHVQVENPDGRETARHDPFGLM